MIGRTIFSKQIQTSPYAVAFLYKKNFAVDFLSTKNRNTFCHEEDNQKCLLRSVCLSENMKVLKMKGGEKMDKSRKGKVEDYHRREEEEKLTMFERIEAFYRQSGGPGNPEIDRILEKHLLYGKDHGIPGKKETAQDAIREVLLDDHSTRDIMLFLLRLRYRLQDEWKAFLKRSDPNLEKIAKALENRVDQQSSGDDHFSRLP